MKGVKDSMDSVSWSSVEVEFHAEMEKLLSRVEDINVAAHRGKGDKVPNPPLYRVKRYRTIYKGTAPSEHFPYYKRLYQSKRPLILNSLRSTKWLESDVLILYGEGVIADPNPAFAIDLSTSFMRAKKLREDAESKLLSGKQPEDSYDLIRDDILLLHLCRIFRILIKDPTNEDRVPEDEKALDTIVRSLEESLSASSESVSPVPAPPPVDFNSLFGGLTEMVSKMGIKPAEPEVPFQGDIGAVLSSIFHDQRTQKTVSDAFDSLKGCTDLGQAINVMTSQLTSPALSEVVRDSFAKNSGSTNGQQGPS